MKCLPLFVLPYYFMQIIFNKYSRGTIIKYCIFKKHSMSKIVFILFLLLVWLFLCIFFAIYIAFESFIKAVELHHVRNKKNSWQEIFKTFLIYYFNLNKQCLSIYLSLHCQNQNLFYKLSKYPSPFSHNVCIKISSIVF